MGRTAYGASDAQARRTLGHVVVGQHADRAGHAGAEELVAGRGEDPEEQPVCFIRRYSRLGA